MPVRGDPVKQQSGRCEALSRCRVSALPRCAALAFSFLFDVKASVRSRISAVHPPAVHTHLARQPQPWLYVVATVSC